MPKDAYFFSHDYNARHDPKVNALKYEYGLEGYGLFWCLIEIVAETKVREIKRKVLIKKLTEEIYKYPNCLIKPKSFIEFCLEINLIKNKKNYIWSDYIGKPITGKQRIRNSFDYKIWRKKVFKRDYYTCQNCGQEGGQLNAHHIKSFAKYPDQRFKLKNGITLCKECHKRRHKAGDRNV